MSEVLLLHENARPVWRRRTTEAIAEFVWRVLLYPSCRFSPFWSLEVQLTEYQGMGEESRQMAMHQSLQRRGDSFYWTAVHVFKGGGKPLTNP
jgi:hypothetical protein